MADEKISAMTAATTPLDGTEVLPIVQGGANRKVAIADVTAGRAITATSFQGIVGNVTPAAGTFTTLTATGAFTSLGIDDNATAEVLQLADGTITVQAGNNLVLSDGNVTLSEGKLTIADSVNETTLLIASGATTNEAAIISAVNVTTGQGLLVTCTALTTGDVAKFRSTSTDTGAHSIVHSINDDPLATGAACYRARNDAGGLAFIAESGYFSVPSTITAGGTTGNQTINKMSGSVNFAATATTLTVTNSLVTANSIILATVATNDATMFSVKAVAGAGSFVLTANAAATAETRVNFLVVNKGD